MHGIEVSPSREGVIAGGVPNSVLRLSRAISLSGDHVSLVTNDRGQRETGKATSEFSVPEIREIRVFPTTGVYGGGRYSLNYTARLINEVARLDRTLGFDVLHGHSGNIEVAVTTWAAANIRSKPSVHTIYSPVKPARIRNTFLCSILNRIDRIIAVSSNVALSLSSVGVREDKITVIPPVMDYRTFTPNCGGNEIRTRLQIEDEPVLLYLGNLSVTKGIWILLEAMKEVVKVVPNVRLLLGLEFTYTGSLDLMNAFQRKIKSYGLSENVFSFGLSKDVCKYIDAADIVIAPFTSTYGVADYPLVVLESMATAKPVISTHVGGLSEIIRSGSDGILVEPGCARILSREILHLLSDEELRARIGQNAYASIRDLLSPERTLEKTRHIYEEIL